MADITQLMKDAALNYKGRMENVIMFEHPEHPGITLSTKEELLTDAPSMKKLAEEKIAEHLKRGGGSLEELKKRMGIASAHTPEIEGLGEKGVAKLLRDITKFGSGWKGLDEGFRTTERSFAGTSRVVTLWKGEHRIGFMNYEIIDGVAAVRTTKLEAAFQGQGLGKALYAETFKHAKAQGAQVFRSDVKKTITQEAQNVWASAQRAGLAEQIAEKHWQVDLTKLENVNRAVMNTGEGAAVVKAGTAEIPSVLKATARIIKNAL